MKNRVLRTLAIAIAAASLSVTALGASASAEEVFEEVTAVETVDTVNAADTFEEAASFQEEAPMVFEDVFEETNDAASVTEAPVFEDVFEEVQDNAFECEAASEVSNYRIATAKIGLSVKAQPSEKSQRIGGVQAGQQVVVVADVYENNGTCRWSKIQWNGGFGYVSGWCGNLTTVNTNPAVPAAQTVNYGIQNVNKNMVVNHNLGLNVYQQADRTSKILANAGNGAPVYVYGYVMANGNPTGYVKVSYNGTVGYVENYLADQTVPTAQPAVQTYQNNQSSLRTVAVSAGALALRSAAENTRASEIGYLPNGSTVQIAGAQVGNFVYVYVVNGQASSFGSSMTGRYGYVNAAYLR